MIGRISNSSISGWLFHLTRKARKRSSASLVLSANTNVNVDDHSVVLNGFKINEVHFPSLIRKRPARWMGLPVPPPPNHTVTMSLDRLVASVEKSKTPPATVKVQNDPPKIFVSDTPAILLNVDGEAERADIAGTSLGFVVKLKLPLLRKGIAKGLLLYSGQQWLKSTSMEGSWSPVPKLPGDFTKVANNPQWAEMKKPILTPSAKGKPPMVFYSNTPAEVILFDGQPIYANIPGTQLSFATNTDADLFVYGSHRAVRLLGCRPLVQGSRSERTVDLHNPGFAPA